MKTIYHIILFFLISLFAQAQSPMMFNYQGAARDAQGQPLSNQNITLRISILQSSTNGTMLYSEVHQVTTSELGIFNLMIGDGMVHTGDLTTINWGQGSFWLQVEMDTQGGSSFQLMGTSQLVSVPYALHAETVNNVNDADADPTNEIQTLVFNSGTNELTITGGNTITIPTGGTDADADPANELQMLMLNGNVLKLTDGNSVDLSAFKDGTEDADADPANELQIISFNPATNKLTLSDGGEVDLSPLDNDGGNGGSGTDDQVLSLSGTMLSIEDGNTVDLDALKDGVEDADADPQNEIQLLLFDSNTNKLSISGGNEISIPTGGSDADSDPQNEIQTISKTGSTVSLSNGGGTFQDAVDDADADSSNELQVLSKSGSLVTLSENGGSFTDETDDADSDPVNEIQLLSRNGDVVTLSRSGGSFTDQKEDADADPNNEIQVLGFDASTNKLTLSNGGEVDLSPLDNDSAGGGSGTDDQILSINGTSLSIEDGNSVDLSAIQDGVTDPDADPMNEIQALSKAGNMIFLSDNGGSVIDEVDDADADSQNEIQVLTKSGNSIELSKGGGAFVDETDDADADPTNEFQTISKNGSTVTLSGNGGSFNDDIDDADADPQNEIQILMKSGDLVELTQGGGFFIDETFDGDADPTNEIQNLMLNGNTLQLTDGNSVDLSSIDTSYWINDGGFLVPELINVGIPRLISDSLISIVNPELPSTTDISPGYLEMEDTWNGEYSNLASRNLKFGCQLSNIKAIYSKDSTYLYSDKDGFNDWTRMLPTGFRAVTDSMEARLNPYTIRVSDQRINQGFFASATEAVLESMIDFTIWTNRNLNFGGYGNNLNQANYGRDSFSLMTFPVGTGFGSESKMNSGRFVQTFGPYVTDMTAANISLDDTNNRLFVSTTGIQAEEALSPSDIFTRFSLKGDSLSLFNSNKFKIAHLGSTSFGNSGSLSLNSNQGKPYTTFNAGDTGSEFEFLHDGQLKIKAVALEDGGILNTYGKNGFENTYLGKAASHDNPNFGGLGVKDDNGLLSAGMEVSELGEGIIYTNGCMRILDESNNQLTCSDRSGFNVLDTSSNYVAFLGRNLIDTNSGYFSLWGTNHSPNVYAGANYDFNGTAETGLVSVSASNGNEKAGIFVDQQDNGTVFSDFGYIGGTPRQNPVYPLEVQQSSDYGFQLTRTDTSWVEFYINSQENLGFYTQNGSVAFIDGATGAYLQVSDRRLKKNIRSIDSSLGKVMQLDPSIYKYKNVESEGKENIGFIAQEVREIFPETVVTSRSKSGDEILTIDYGSFAVIGIKAIQEQQEIIETQNQTIQEQESKIQSMERRLSKIEELLAQQK